MSVLTIVNALPNNLRVIVCTRILEIRTCETDVEYQPKQLFTTIGSDNEDIL